ncbi:MAG: hypothetical protein ABWY00_07315 [Dongiaceae bacterium]
MIFYGNASGRITLRIERDVLWLTLEEDPRGADIVQSFRDAISDGLLKAGLPTVIDMLGFNGNIDWQAIRLVREMVAEALPPPAGETSRLPAPAAPCRVAYVTRDMLFSPVLRILRDLFPQCRHRQFRDPETALLWVCQRDPVALDED